jgi:hypothetical protein
MSVFLIVVLYTTARSQQGGGDCVPLWYQPSKTNGLLDSQYQAKCVASDTSVLCRAAIVSLVCRVFCWSQLMRTWPPGGAIFLDIW